MANHIAIKRASLLNTLVSYVDDVVQQFIGLMEAGQEVRGRSTSATRTNFREFGEKTLAKVGGGSWLIEEPLLKDNPKQRQPNIDAASDALGWFPTV